MGAMTLLVDRRGAELKLSSNRQVVCLRYPDGEEHRVGVYALRRIVVHGDASVSTAVIRAAEAAQVSMIFLPGQSKGNFVNMFPYGESHFKLRFAQYQSYFDEDIRLSLARKMVVAKIRAQSECLNRHHLKHDFSKSEAQVNKVFDNAALMGIEGSVSKSYLEKWRTLWDDTWGFKERNRRPPLDPVNALLSLGYTLAGNSVGHLASLYGLDLALGFLHIPSRNRPSLALDVLEPVRPKVDQWLWQKVQDGLFTPKHFYQTKDNGCRLDKKGRSIFFPAWYDDAEAYLQKPMRDSLALMLGTLRQQRYNVLYE